MTIKIYPTPVGTCFIDTQLDRCPDTGIDYDGAEVSDNEARAIALILARKWSGPIAYMYAAAKAWSAHEYEYIDELTAEAWTELAGFIDEEGKADQYIDEYIPRAPRGLRTDHADLD